MVNLMATAIYNLYEAKTSLSKLVERAASGEEIIIAKAGRPLARLTAFPKQRQPRTPGGWENTLWIGADFDEPLPEDCLFQQVRRTKIVRLVQGARS